MNTAVTSTVFHCETICTKRKSLILYVNTLLREQNIRISVTYYNYKHQVGFLTVMSC